jgi:hypothetical protein
MASSYDERYVPKSRFSGFLMFLKKWMLKLKLSFTPPKKGDIYIGDNFDFLIGKPMEQILHGLRNRNGDPIYDPAIGIDSYKVTIIRDSMPYYVLECHSLVYATGSKSGSTEFKWLKRNQDRRIMKDLFQDMILEGRLKKYDSDF